MTANEFLEYIDYFESGRYDDYYTDDVVFQLPQRKLVGKQAVKDYYNHLNQYLREVMYVKKVLSEGNALVAHLFTDFVCIRDWPEFHIKPMKKGEVYRGEYLILYKLRDGKFCHIRSARLTPVTD
jgi:ketosteroid isomerase-like protein